MNILQTNNSQTMSSTDLLKLINQARKDFEELNPLTVETEKGVALPQGGFAKPSRYYMLTEDQCYS